MKVLGFDSWTQGAHHFERLIPALARRDMSLKLVHLGSWGNEPGRRLRENIGALQVADIASYPSSSLRALLEVERPDAVILLSTTTFAHRALIRHCKSMGIPTLNLYHGMSTTWFDASAESGFEPNAWGHLKIVIGKLYKTLRFTLPCYLTSLVATSAPLADWRRFFLDVAWLAMGRHPRIAAEDARTTRCAVYVPADIEHATQTFGFSPEEITVVGNPDLARFGLKDAHIGVRLRQGEYHQKAIMYVDTALQPNGLTFPSLAAFVDHLSDAARGLRSNGFRMLVKLHPANDIERIRAMMAGTDVEFVDNESFVERLLTCEAAIVETTTLAMIPALMGMPLLFANFGALHGLRFGSALTSYPRGHLLRDLADVPGILQKERGGGDPKAVEQWIGRSVGPLPAELMPERVAELLESMVRNRSVESRQMLTQAR